MSVVALVLLAYMNAAVFAQAGPRSASSPTELVTLVESWISATSWLGEMRDSFAEATNGASTDGVNRLMREMAANRLAVAKLQNAVEDLPSPTTFPRGSIEWEAVEAYRTTVTGLRQGIEKAFVLDQKLVALDSQADLAKVMADTAELGAEMDAAWKFLATLVLTYALVDRDRTTDGRLQHLRITSAQRRQLISTIRKRFPTAGNELLAGQHPVEGSVALLTKALDGPHKSSDAP
jgi:hypothetical protein